MDWPFGFPIWSGIFKMNITSPEWRCFSVSMCTALQSTSRWKIRFTNMGSLWMTSKWATMGFPQGLFLGGSHWEDKHSIWQGSELRGACGSTARHGSPGHTRSDSSVCPALAPQSCLLLGWFVQVNRSARALVIYIAGWFLECWDFAVKNVGTLVHSALLTLPSLLKLSASCWVATEL